MIIEAAAKTANFTADGTATGIVTVASTAGFYPNARAYISGTVLAGFEVEIVKIIDGLTMAVRRVSNVPNYGYTDISAYTVVAGGKIVQPPQTVQTFAFSSFEQYLAQSGQPAVEPPPEVIGGAPSVALAVSAVDATVNLVAGVQYRVFSSVDGYLRVGEAATAVTGTPVSARTPELMSFAPAGALAPAVHFLGTGAGTVWFTPVI